MTNHLADASSSCSTVTIQKRYEEKERVKKMEINVTPSPTDQPFLVTVKVNRTALEIGRRQRRLDDRDSYLIDYALHFFTAPTRVYESTKFVSPFVVCC